MGGPRAKPGKSAAPKPATPAPKSGANTTRSVYLDSAWQSDACASDRGTVNEKCKEKPAAQKKDEKTRAGGLLRRVRQVTSGLNDAGKANNNYAKGKPSGNEWMDDHCDGMWVKPQFNGIDDVGQQLTKYKSDLNKLGDTVDSYMKNPGKIVKASYEQLSRQAIDKLGYDNVRNMLLKKFGGDALLAALPVKAGAAAKIAAVAKGGFSAAGYVSGAQQLAATLGTDHAKELLQGIEYMLGEKKERLVALQSVWKDRPDVVMAELMSLNGEFDSCLRARKCHFVPFRNNGKKNSSNGRGCCPGQTAHHVIPHAAAKDAKCTGYTYGGGLTICLEGQDNTYGSHGRAHEGLDKLIENYNGLNKPPKPISYTEMRKKALEALKENTDQCKKPCLEKQLDEYYKNCGDLTAKSGKGGPIPTGEEDQTPPVR
ncbi:hypothetical protein LXA47_05200 [Massilia sp. P8910]|uniref:hypothetical protein n=1 Tax=Massilia antarctica TaxID=2765360 RepID=UPI001E52FBCE|nr:hypothetical protein [Massilia antarctica]MCE3602999.1 hypothetical protein [Massilia antarctica]